MNLDFDEIAADYEYYGEIGGKPSGSPNRGTAGILPPPAMSSGEPAVGDDGRTEPYDVKKIRFISCM